MNRGEVQIWHASADRLVASLSTAEISAVLDRTEIEKLNSLSKSEVRNEFLATRYLIRTLLSHYNPEVPPKAWKFTSNEFGKPTTDCKIGSHSLEFNISHSGGIVVCAFLLGAPVGVDIESSRRKIPWFDVAKDSFSQQEVDELRKVKSSELPQRFFEYWTLKEAFIKAMGMGLSLPLGEFWFQFAARNRIGIGFSSKIAEKPADWQFRLFEIEGHQCALAVKCGSGKDISFAVMGDYSEILRKLEAA